MRSSQAVMSLARDLWRAACLVSAALVLLALSAIGTGCTVTYPEGVIACGGDAQCPSGWSCRAMRCYSTASASDASVDAGAEDATARDAETDAGPVDLGCPATGPTNATCPWHFGRPHAVPSLHPSTTGLFSAALTADGETIYVANWTTSENLPIYEASRASSAEPFGALVATLGSANVNVRPGVLSMTEDGLEMFAQVVDGRGDVQMTIVRYQPVVFDLQPWALGEPDADPASRYLAVSGSSFTAVAGAGLASVREQSIWPTW